MQFNVYAIQGQSAHLLFEMKKAAIGFGSKIGPVNEIVQWFKDNDIKWRIKWDNQPFLVIKDEEAAMLFKLTWIGA